MPIKAFVFDAYGTLYDVHSIARAIETAFPGRGDYITQVWRLKQLEYSWLRSMMGRYQDFAAVSRESLLYTLGTLGLTADDRLIASLLEGYDRLDPYSDALEALEALAGHRLAILSNGSPAMLEALLRNTGLDRIEMAISVDAKRVYKPDPRAYELVEERLGVKPHEVVFVSSNGFDIAGAKNFGFRVARIERVTSRALGDELSGAGTIDPAMMFRALRSQQEALGFQADEVIGSLRELAGIAARG